MLYSNGFYQMQFGQGNRTPDFFTAFVNEETEDGFKKKMIMLVKPSVFVYINKKAPGEDEVRLPLYIEADKVDKVSVPYSPKAKMRAIAYELGDEEPDRKTTMAYLKDRYYLNPMVHDADMDIEDYFMDVIDRKYDRDVLITKAYFDIETNGVKYKGFVEPDAPEAAIVMMGIFIDGTFYEYLFRDPDVEDPDMDKFFDDKKFREKIGKEIIAKQGQYGLEKIKFRLFDDEIDMIESFYAFVNEVKPEMLAAWNIKYDIQYSMNRYSLLCGSDIAELEDLTRDDRVNFGYKRSFFTKEARYMISDTEALEKALTELVAHQKLVSLDSTLSKSKREEAQKIYEQIHNLPVEKLIQAYYYEDVGHDDYADKGDAFKTISYTNYVDQMLIYAYVRKSTKKSSYSLDAVASDPDELDDHKEQLPPGVTMQNFFSKEWVLALKYNVHDVMLQVRLEDKNKDMDLMWASSQNSSTRLNKAGKKTVAIRNLARKIYRDQGYVLSNNHNTNYDGSRPKKVKLPGGFVGDPTLIGNVGKLLTFTNLKSSKIFDNTIDEDLTSQYPSIIIALGIEDPTLVGKLQLERKVPIADKPGVFKRIDDGWTIIDAYISGDNISIAHKFLNLPDLSQMMLLLESKLEVKK